ncbi:ParA family protein [Tersicoccus sp. Bi-70]|uniref:ParA family protein n=1 Tax=Tersicoccus sp. Bi-70 TaxID=1897634 RepID=UPI0009777AC5|nr:AAA family ATPase [Tersicoccus sp. Bi-70]OMH32543.1 cobalamin biosynthesis protein CobQ [Tersicoccus sp. Bi-70]
MSARVIALCNQKGGVGKTVTTYHLARAAVRRGLRVLVIDADPQGNLTASAAGDDVAADDIGLADVLSSRAPETLSDVIVPGIWDGLSVVPTTGIELAAVRDELITAGAGREMRLREALAPLLADYDLVLIDCAPSLDQLTVNALTAADAVLIISQAKLYSLNGLDALLTTISSVRSYYNADLRVAGIIVNLYNPRTISARGWLDELTTAAQGRGLSLFEPIMNNRVVIADASEAARGLDEWGSSDARELADVYDAYLTATLEGANA